MLAKSNVSQWGMTLLSMMIALSIVGILSSIAIPGYQHFIRRSEMHEARNQLMVWQGEQIRYRLGNDEFAPLEALSVPVSQTYRFSVSNVSSTTFILLAARNNVVEDGCDTLTLTHAAEFLPRPCWR